MRTLWTDGSASPNPGPGGFAVIENGQPIALGREDDSTNIRMEGSALMAALNILGDEPGRVYTDSEFWINVLTVWAPKWESDNWVKKGGKIKNLEMVQELYELYCSSNAEVVWVRGHEGTEMNELADKWANKARKGESL